MKKQHNIQSRLISAGGKGCNIITRAALKIKLVRCWGPNGMTLETHANTKSYVRYWRLKAQLQTRTVHSKCLLNMCWGVRANHYSPHSYGKPNFALPHHLQTKFCALRKSFK